MLKYGLQDIPIETIEEETLGLMTYVESLSDFILKCETPLTIAIQGDWGSGKTSLMNLVKTQLQAKPMIDTIWFNTWQYSQFGLEDELAISLLSHFLDTLGADENTKKVLNAVKSGVKKFAKFIPTIVSTAAGGVGQSLAEKITDYVFDENVDSAKQINSLKEEIKNTVERRIRNDEAKKIVVFIDDLDRLLPVRAVELLEIFKLFMDVRGCIYVLACDYEIVSQGLKQKFKLGVDRLKGRSFFDKIIQLPFNMPIGQYDVLNYFRNLLAKIEVEFEEKDLSIYKELVDESIGFNPRNMKRLFNLMLLLNEVANRKNLFDIQDGIGTKRSKQRILFAILCLQAAFEQVYNEISKEIGDNLEMLFCLARVEEYAQEDVFDDEESRTSKYEEFKTKMNDPGGTQIEKLLNFIRVFYKSIQIDEDKTQLSPEEWMVFKQMFSLSVITSVSTGGIKIDSEFDFRENGTKLAKDIRLRAKNQHQIQKKHWLYFQYSPVYGKKGSAMRIDLDFKHKDPKFSLEFLFEEGHAEAYLCGIKKAAKIWCPLINKNCNDFFPKREIHEADKKFLVLWEDKWENGITIQNQYEQFREKVFNTVDNLIPKFFKEEKKSEDLGGKLVTGDDSENDSVNKT